MGAMAHVDSEKFWECISMFTIVSLVQNKTEMFEIMIRALKIIKKPLHQLVLKVMLEEEQKEKEEKEEKEKTSSADSSSSTLKNEVNNEEEENVECYEDPRVMSVRDAVKLAKEKGYY